MNNGSILSIYRESIDELMVLDDEEWGVFAGHLRVRRLKRNENFVAAGRICRDMGFIVKGAVRFCSVVDDKDITGYFCFEGSFVTALKSYLTAEPCLYDVKALEETILVTISRKNVLELSAHPVFGLRIERMSRLISERFNVLFEDRLKSFVVKTAEERYLDLLRSGKDIVNRIPVQYLAQYIGITPVSLSRIRKRIVRSSADAPGK